MTNMIWDLAKKHQDNQSTSNLSSCLGSKKSGTTTHRRQLNPNYSEQTS
jgi:hypothetical protein